MRLVSDMTEEDILSEIRSVFEVPMGNDPNFQFVFLQRCGPGSNALTIPSLSASFSWTAKEVVRLAGQGCLYVKAESDLVVAKPESEPEVSAHDKESCSAVVNDTARYSLSLGVHAYTLIIIVQYTCTYMYRWF